MWTELRVGHGENMAHRLALEITLYDFSKMCAEHLKSRPLPCDLQ